MATTGSIRSARQAGPAAEAAAVRTSTIATRTKVAGSCGCTPNSIVVSRRPRSAARLLCVHTRDPSRVEAGDAQETQTSDRIPRVTNRRFALAALILLLVPPTVGAQGSAPTPASRASDDFESGSLANWQIQANGAGGWFVYTDGQTPPDQSKTDPFWPFEAADPPQGKFAAVSDMNGTGLFILYRDIVLDGRYNLTMNVYYVNEGRFTTEATLAESHVYRIDVMSPTAPLTSIARSDIFATIFQGRPNDAARQVPTELTRDLSQWAGQTIRLRLVSSGNQGPLRAGVDQIRFTRLP